ncbi:MAG TPA: RseA family anti-sigma factor [Noviherbaspirillum sp.]
MAQPERDFMNTKEMTQEQISAFADGECADAHLEIVLASLRQAEGKADWDIYHQIGDVLRSGDMAVSLSSGFAARMAACLDEEPAIVAPSIAAKPARTSTEENRVAAATRSMKRWALPGMLAAAAAAATTFIVTPQLMVAMKGEPGIDDGSMMAASSSRARSGKPAVSISDVEQGRVVAASMTEGIVLRDARIDEYLLAHQRFSPSLYSTARYARSATFATDSDR